MLFDDWKKQVHDLIFKKVKVIEPLPLNENKIEFHGEAVANGIKFIKFSLMIYCLRLFKNLILIDNIGQHHLIHQQAIEIMEIQKNLEMHIFGLFGIVIKDLLNIIVIVNIDLFLSLDFSHFLILKRLILIHYQKIEELIVI